MTAEQSSQSNRNYNSHNATLRKWISSSPNPSTSDDHNQLTPINDFQLQSINNRKSRRDSVHDIDWHRVLLCIPMAFTH